MAESASLLNWNAGNRIAGSNPVPSVIVLLWSFMFCDHDLECMIEPAYYISIDKNMYHFCEYHAPQDAERIEEEEPV